MTLVYIRVFVPVSVGVSMSVFGSKSVQAFMYDAVGYVYFHMHVNTIELCRLSLLALMCMLYMSVCEGMTD